MFRQEGRAAGDRRSALLAGYLAFTAGYVNSGGFVLLGIFTSHVTGSIGRLGDDIARGDRDAGIFALLLVVTFFAGAFVASLLVESMFRELFRAYGTALFVEGLLLAAFIAVAGGSGRAQARILDAEAGLLCFAMGMQNSLITRLSGAVIRTTHLTGVITDLGIEAARWYRWRRSHSRLPALLPGREAPTRPAPARAVLLAAIGGAFTCGAIAGASLTLRASRWAMLAPSLLVFVASAYAFSSRSRRSPTER